MSLGSVCVLRASTGSFTHVLQQHHHHFHHARPNTTVYVRLGIGHVRVSVYVSTTILLHHYHHHHRSIGYNTTWL